MVDIGRWERIGRLFMCAWVLFTVPSVIQVIRLGFGGPELAVTLGFVFWAAIWIWFWMRALGQSRSAQIVGLAANIVVLSLFALIAPWPVGVGGVLVFAFIVAGVSFPAREAVWVLAGLTALQVMLTVITQEGPAVALSSLLNSVLVGGVGIGARLLWQSYTELLAARERLTQLAISDERLRFARDLHDLLGQSLSVIVLKSELLAKQLPQDVDESLSQELRDVARVARKSLNDVREAVSGYHRPSLNVEIGNARSSLRAAGIGFVVEDKLGRVPLEQDAVLAWCLREAVTNVLKHSGARRCVVHLSRENGEARLDVGDDGRGATAFDGGSGLPGLRDRVELAGGRLDVETAAGKGLRLQVSVPAGLYSPSELVRD